MTSERGLAGYVAADAWFVVCGVVVGLVVGVVAWRALGRTGWPVVLVTVVVGAAAGFVCWGVGYLLGPGAFDVRLAAAKPGDLVPVELTVRARAALLVWPLFALVPVLLGTSLGRDPEDLPYAPGSDTEPDARPDRSADVGEGEERVRG